MRLTITNLDHIVFNVSDVDASIAFYRDVLGLSIERLDDFRASKVEFPSVRIDANTIIDLFPPAMHGAREGNGSNVNHVALAVAEDAEAIAAFFADRGLALLRFSPQNVGARGTGAAYYTHDPDGNTIELRTYQRK